MGKVEELRKKLIKKAREEVREKYTGRDPHIIKAVGVLDSLDGVFNLLSEQIREWYGIIFPELERAARDNEAYLKMVYNLGEKKNYGQENVLKHYKNRAAAKRIETLARESIGPEAKQPDLKEIQLLAVNALNLKEERGFLLKYVEKAMQEIAGNTSKVAGPLLGARLLAIAGSLKKLAFYPSSTIQVIGAEKALFQAIKTKGKGPKHGLIFQHPLVQRVKRGNRGRMARTLAGKIAIAAKQDYFGKKDISRELLAGLERRAQELSGKKK